MLEILKAFINVILDLLFPHFCFGCNLQVHRYDEICERCKEKIERIDGKICLKCGHSEKNCECKNRVYHFEAVASPFLNKGIARDGIYKMKFQPNHFICKYFSEEMLKTVQTAYKDIKFDFICPVPIKTATRISRGFNQSEEMANYLSNALNVDINNRAIRRLNSSKIQHELVSCDERVKNAYAAFVPGKKKVRGNVLLVDDIATTKATLDSCALCLLKNGAEKVYCITAVLSSINELDKKENKYATDTVI